ncbi:MAG: hypothetical protein R3250_04060 [Melioribacteraceae bacterium]|nr:hypothetical protein [Melioribacteraceae bacterium]
MKISEVHVECTRSRNFQTAKIGMSAELSEDEDYSIVIRELSIEARLMAEQQLDIAEAEKEAEEQQHQEEEKHKEDLNKVKLTKAMFEE